MAGGHHDRVSFGYGRASENAADDATAWAALVAYRTLLSSARRAVRGAPSRSAVARFRRTQERALRAFRGSLESAGYLTDTANLAFSPA
jgi:hypothetical protein